MSVTKTIYAIGGVFRLFLILAKDYLNLESAVVARNAAL